MISVKKFAAALILLVLSTGGLTACHRTPDEVQVRHSIEAMAGAAKAASAADLVASLSADFDGNGGELDSRSLGNLMRVLSLRGEHVGVIIGPITIEPRGERMLARFTVTLSSGGNLLPDQLGMYAVESAWRVEDGHWRCYSASWKRAM